MLGEVRVASATIPITPIKEEPLYTLIAKLIKTLNHLAHILFQHSIE
jgi:hypothetical protein